MACDREHALVGIDRCHVATFPESSRRGAGEHAGAAPYVEYLLSGTDVGGVEHGVGPLPEQRRDEERVVDLRRGRGNWLCCVVPYMDDMKYLPGRSIR